VKEQAMGLKDWWDRITGGTIRSAGQERGFRESSDGAGSIAGVVDTPTGPDSQHNSDHYEHHHHDHGHDADSGGDGGGDGSDGGGGSE
jgi:hypothetical protein